MDFTLIKEFEHVEDGHYQTTYGQDMDLTLAEHVSPKNMENLNLTMIPGRQGPMEFSVMDLTMCEMPAKCNVDLITSGIPLPSYECSVMDLTACQFEAKCTTLNTEEIPSGEIKNICDMDGIDQTLDMNETIIDNKKPGNCEGMDLDMTLNTQPDEILEMKTQSSKIEQENEDMKETNVQPNLIIAENECEISLTNQVSINDDFFIARLFDIETEIEDFFIARLFDIDVNEDEDLYIGRLFETDKPCKSTSQLVTRYKTSPSGYFDKEMILRLFNMFIPPKISIELPVDLNNYQVIFPSFFKPLKPYVVGRKKYNHYEILMNSRCENKGMEKIEVALMKESEDLTDESLNDQPDLKQPKFYEEGDKENLIENTNPKKGKPRIVLTGIDQTRLNTLLRRVQKARDDAKVNYESLTTPKSTLRKKFWTLPPNNKITRRKRNVAQSEEEAETKKGFIKRNWNYLKEAVARKFN